MLKLTYTPLVLKVPVRSDPIEIL